jgi:hypothetical protein
MEPCNLNELAGPNVVLNSSSWPATLQEGIVLKSELAAELKLRHRRSHKKIRTLKVRSGQAFQEAHGKKQ